MKQVKKRRFEALNQRHITIVKTLMGMPNAGTDADFERVVAVDKRLQVMCDARPMTISLDLKELKDDRIC